MILYPGSGDIILEPNMLITSQRATQEGWDLIITYEAFPPYEAFPHKKMSTKNKKYIAVEFHQNKFSGPDSLTKYGKTDVISSFENCELFFVNHVKVKEGYH